MKQLQLTPPLLILTMGYPGSGKTYFARQFADEYKLARISEDRIRFELFEKPTFAAEEFEIIQRMGMYMVEQLMQTKQTIVYDGMFLQTHERLQVQQLAKQNGYRVLIVWLQTDIETSAQRANQRDRRNPDSKYSFSLDRQTFDTVRSTLQRPHEKDSVVVISGKHANKSQCLTVLRKITTVYSENLGKGRPATPAHSRASTDRPNVRPGQRFVQ